MITRKVCLLVWVVSARTVAFHVVCKWRASRIFGMASSVGTLQAFDGKQQRSTGDPKVSALSPLSRVDRAFACFFAANEYAAMRPKDKRMQVGGVGHV